jgi:hypothetical protein
MRGQGCQLQGSGPALSDGLNFGNHVRGHRRLHAGGKKLLRLLFVKPQVIGRQFAQFASHTVALQAKRRFFTAADHQPHGSRQSVYQ